jgi:endonuclease/exonuclease/phosphatase family metal-dependent hydrolase
VLGALLVQPAGDYPEPRQTLTLMTFNIHGGYGPDDALDLRRIARMVIEAGPDVVALQDVNRGDARNGFTDEMVSLADLLRPAGYRYWTFGPVDGLFVGNALLSRYQIVANENYLYSPEQGADGSFLLARVKIGGRRVTFFTTRFDSGDATAQTQALLALTDSETLPVAVLGDLGAGPEAPHIQQMAGRLTDAYVAAGGPTPGFTYPAGRPERRVDYVFVGSGLQATAARVAAGELASSHLPVVVQVQIAP